MIFSNPKTKPYILESVLFSTLFLIIVYFLYIYPQYIAAQSGVGEFGLLMLYSIPFVLAIFVPISIISFKKIKELDLKPSFLVHVIVTVPTIFGLTLMYVFMMTDVKKNIFNPVYRIKTQILEKELIVQPVSLKYEGILPNVDNRWNEKGPTLRLDEKGPTITGIITIKSKPMLDLEINFARVDVISSGVNQGGGGCVVNGKLATTIHQGEKIAFECFIYLKVPFDYFNFSNTVYKFPFREVNNPNVYNVRIYRTSDFFKH